MAGEVTRAKLQCRNQEVYVRIPPHLMDSVTRASRGRDKIKIVSTYWIGKPEALYQAMSTLTGLCDMDSLRWKRELVEESKQCFLRSKTESSARYWAVAFRQLLEGNFAGLAAFTRGEGELPKLDDSNLSDHDPHHKYEQ